jgi:hypothetical protein
VFTGVTPLEEFSDAAAVARISAGIPPFSREQCSTVDTELITVIEPLLSPNPEIRLSASGVSTMLAKIVR